MIERRFKGFVIGLLVFTFVTACGGSSPEVSLSEIAAQRAEPDDVRAPTENAALDQVPAATEEVVGRGNMAVTMGSERLAYDGPCAVSANGGRFSSAEPHPSMGELSISFEVHEAPEDSNILADLSISLGEYAGEWTMLQVHDDGSYPEIKINPTGFRVQGFMVNSADGTIASVSMGTGCDN